MAALGLPVVICVLVDDSLALIELKQRGTQRPNLGVDFGGPGAGTGCLATPLRGNCAGGHGVEVVDRETLAQRSLPRRALTRDRFTLIAARIPRRAYDLGVLIARATERPPGHDRVRRRPIPACAS